MGAFWQAATRPHIQFRNLGRTRMNGFSPSVRVLRNPMVLVMFMVVLALWSRHAGLLTSFYEFISDSKPSPLSVSASNLFTYGAIRVEKALQHEGYGTDSFRKFNKNDDISKATATEQQRIEDPKVGTPYDTSEIDRSEQVMDGSGKLQTLLPITNEEKDSYPLSEPGKEIVQLKPVAAQSEAPPPTSHEGTKPILREVLNFSEKTTINFMHFHKTGGVGFKAALLNFYKGTRKGNGNPVVARDACYVREGVSNDESQPSFMVWRCDWMPLRELNVEERNKHDFVFGHQFWGNGIGKLLNRRDLRTFTILRHPFDRKVSFYYHFFVREIGRKEEGVSFDEIRDFLLYDKLTIDADLGRDLGPNYMAGRLLSNGIKGFAGNSSYSYFAVDQDKKQEVADKAVRLIQDYVFIGLQEESPASQCMLRKVIEEFNHVNGISNDGVEKIDRNVDRLNRGSYSMSAKDIWSRFSPEDRGLFDKNERVDLTIYLEGERLFRKQVKLFGCTHRLTNLR